VGAPGITAQYVAIPPGVEYGFDWRGDTHFLAFHDIQMRDGETHADALPVKRVRDARNTFTFIPSGCRVWGWTAPTKTDNSFVAIYLDPRRLRAEIGARMSGAMLQPDVFFKAPALLGTIGKLRRALSEGDQIDQLYAESLCVLATMEFCRHRERGFAEEDSARIGKAALSRIDEYIQAHLGRPISLDDLAQLADLSRFHFLRAFKTSSGETPYQRVLRMRVERAEELLSEGRSTVAEVAKAVGFKSPSRFIATFRRARETTPRQFAALHASGNRSGGAKSRKRSIRRTEA
jgi:AraC family transcriptional regulator